ncbi:hypothetical protein AB0H36_11925 [Kribbella sp. NPDC050820]|uniref:hypothetical protein n=1 Tax=Kribbella sp. NPDC050820 TaxID=3155408 RepID=UPI0033CB67B0
MELVSATAGGLWSDRPTCTPPVLAHIARVVNDHTSPARRPRLAPLIPYLITSSDPIRQDRTDIEACRAILAAAGNAIRPDITTTWATQLDQLLTGRLSRRRRHKLLSITGAALRAIHDTSQPLDRDEQLRKALVAAINAERRIQGTPALLSDDLQPLPELSVTVLARLIKPPGADWYEVEAHLDPETTPDWLSRPMRLRTHELPT